MTSGTRKFNVGQLQGTVRKFKSTKDLLERNHSLILTISILSNLKVDFERFTLLRKFEF